VAPLMGCDSSRDKNWMNGLPVRLLAYRIPNDPARDRWVPEVLSESLHVMHNFWPVPTPSGTEILTASYEGVSLVSRAGDRCTTGLMGAGNQEPPEGSRGASEIKRGQLKGDHPFLATIEPWHGHQVVVYTPPADPKALWERHVLDDRLKWGHAVWCADLDGDGGDELIIGVRDNRSDRPGEKCGVRIYRAADERGTKWERHLLDEGGVAGEGLAAAELRR